MPHSDLSFGSQRGGLEGFVRLCGVGSHISRQDRYQSYQQASERVKTLIADRSNGSPIERASIDEFYVDLTNHAAEATHADLEDQPALVTPASDVHIEGAANVALLSPGECRMLVASALVREIRYEIFTKEGLTVSGAFVPSVEL